MAYRRGRFEADAPASMFSPSVARIAATEAKDWSFVDCWVAAQFPDRQPPPFERNADTMRALLALIAFSDTASEEAHLIARVDRDALRELPRNADSAGNTTLVTPSAMRESLLHIIEQELPKEGRIALDSMSSMALSTKISLPEPEHLGAAIIGTQSAIFEVEQMASRAESLGRNIHSEIVHANNVLKTMQDEVCSVPEGLAKRNLELQRTVKAMTAQVPEFGRRIASLKSATASSDFTVHDILREEDDFIALVENKKELENRISVFRGLPSNPDLARDELNAYRRELQGIMSQRDAAFRGLVERETPAKR
ncbi:hypothetical protein LMH87_005802 [Akanthomyces muscarius]|uniref:HAUS augmin-like complex subunit 1 n=1 Tax=Akanthomyces muscarius TaxID=2231603 RepID=A0A9W8QLG9_AKAMU|nr:hypothetical protein LMH87_005802 [Akanthomyces muscarius]KAJ4164116.1 hypothetical protein LMH87_005802 [Akanthomyces muscarius]